MRNPIVSGFHPDPSVVRVGDDYYLANSTFEYFPGIPIFHSTDLEHWELLTHVAVRDGQLGSDKAATGGGAWAPTIRHHDGRFWLVIPDMMGGRGNVLYTADRVEGPWSDGIVMDVLGIDPDIAWGPDGTCYVTMSGFILEGTLLTHLGITQVRKLNSFLQRRREIAAVFTRAVMQSRHGILAQKAEGENVNFSFPVLLDSGMKDVQAYARKKGVETRPAFTDSALAGLSSEEGDGLPKAKALMLRCLLFPLYPTLTTEGIRQIERTLASLP